MPVERATAREAAARIVRVLRDAGHVAYFAGGCVRDELMGFEPQDYDVATDALPDGVRRLFRGARFVGEAFGVTRVRMDGHDVEVATFRTESGYQDGRRPTQVAFTDARHDAQRRDFTINGLFEDPFAPTPQEQIIDFVGGRDDLAKKIIRAIGEPDARLAEDYLRMLRAVRFAARLGFTLEERTARAIQVHALRLGQISRERIGQEVLLMLDHPNRAQAATLLQDLHLDEQTLNENHHAIDTPTLRALPAETTRPAALAAWLLDRWFHPQLETESFVADEAETILRRWRKALCLSNELYDATRAAVFALPRAMAWPTLGVAQRKRLLATTAWPDTLRLIHAMAHRPGIGDLVKAIEVESQPLLAQGVAPPPLVTGDDLVAMGRAPGPVFKQLLDTAYDRQLEGRLTTKEQAMAWLREQP